MTNQDLERENERLRYELHEVKTVKVNEFIKAAAKTISQEDDQLNMRDQRITELEAAVSNALYGEPLSFGNRDDNGLMRGFTRHYAVKVLQRALTHKEQDEGGE